MRVLHIISGLGDGGAEATLYRLCYADRTNKIFVISLKGHGKYVELLKKSGCEVFCLSINLFNFFPKFFLLTKIIRSISPDIVQTWMYHADFIGGLAAKLANVERIFWGVHNTILEFSKSSFSSLLISRLSVILSRIIPEKIVYCAISSKHIHENIGYDKRKSVVIYNGYDLSKFSPEGQGLDCIQFDGESIKLGMFARYNVYKDFPNLIHALYRLKNKEVNFKCYLAGHGVNNENKELYSLISEYDLNDHICLLGVIHNPQFAMRVLDISILSSQAEAFPNVLSESMACGTPCVSTFVGDSKFIVGEYGWLCPPKDSLALSQAIETAISELKNEPDRFFQRSVEGRKHIEDNFSIDNMLSHYTELWTM